MRLFGFMGMLLFFFSNSNAQTIDLNMIPEYEYCDSIIRYNFDLDLYDVFDELVTSYPDIDVSNEDYSLGGQLPRHLEVVTNGSSYEVLDGHDWLAHQRTLELIDGELQLVEDFQVTSDESAQYCLSYDKFINIPMEVGDSMNVENLCDDAFFGHNKIFVGQISSLSTPFGSFDELLVFKLSHFFQGYNRSYAFYSPNNIFKLMAIASFDSQNEEVDFTFFKSNCLLVEEITDYQEGDFEDDLYPNPTNDFVQIIMNEEKSYVVYSTYGEILLSGNLTVGNNQIDVSELLPGAYLMNFEGSIQRFVKY